MPPRLPSAVRAQTNWHNILAEALRQNRLDALLQVVHTAYGDNPTLQTALGHYRHLIDQGGHIEPPAPLAADSDQPQPLKPAAAPTLPAMLTADEGDVIGRDQQIAGDKVGRDKIEGDQIDARECQRLYQPPDSACNAALWHHDQIGSLKIPIYLVIIISVCVIGIFGVVAYPLVEQWLPTPHAFATQAEGETLIVIATFHNTAATNSEPHTKIRRAIATEAAKQNEQTVAGRSENKPN